MTCDTSWYINLYYNIIFILLSAGIYLFIAYNRNTRAIREILWKLTIKTSERRKWHRSGVVVSFERISYNDLMFPLLLWTNKCWLGSSPKSHKGFLLEVDLGLNFWAFCNALKIWRHSGVFIFNFEHISHLFLKVC